MTEYARIRMPKHFSCNAWCRGGKHAQLIYLYGLGGYHSGGDLRSFVAGRIAGGGRGRS